MAMFKHRCSPPFSGALSQLIEVLLPGTCRQFGLNTLTQILHRFPCFFVNTGFSVSAVHTLSSLSTPPPGEPNAMMEMFGKWGTGECLARKALPGNSGHGARRRRQRSAPGGTETLRHRDTPGPRSSELSQSTASTLTWSPHGSRVRAQQPAGAGSRDPTVLITHRPSSLRWGVHRHEAQP